MIKAKHIAVFTSAALLISGTVFTKTENAKLTNSLNDCKSQLETSQKEVSNLSSRLSNAEALYDELTADL